MNHKNQGFGLLGILIVLAIIAGGGYLVAKNITKVNTTLTPTATTSSPIEQAKQVVKQVVQNNQVAVDETVGWKTYVDSKRGIEFKYPSDSNWELEKSYGNDQGSTVSFDANVGRVSFVFPYTLSGLVAPIISHEDLVVNGQPVTKEIVGTEGPDAVRDVTYRGTIITAGGKRLTFAVQGLFFPGRGIEKINEFLSKLDKIVRSFKISDERIAIETDDNATKMDVYQLKSMAQSLEAYTKNYHNLCVEDKKLIYGLAALKQRSKEATCRVSPDEKSYIVAANLSDGYFCADSTGYIDKVEKAPPADQYSCK